MSEKYPDDRGSLWIDSDNKMSGTINGERVVVWRNDRKEPGSKQPDWRVKADKREKSARGPAPEPVTDQDVPFAWALPLLMPLAAAGVWLV